MCFHVKGAALRLENDKEISGIFSHETHANILETLMWHRYLKNDISLDELRKKTSAVLFERAHWRMQEPGDQKSSNCNAKQRRKCLNESLQKSLQIVKWTLEVRRYTVEWLWIIFI